jgi:hypothetical protein
MRLMIIAGYFILIYCRNRRTVLYIFLTPYWDASYDFFSFGATAPIWALAYLHETLCFTSVLQILDSQ